MKPIALLVAVIIGYASAQSQIQVCPRGAGQLDPFGKPSSCPCPANYACMNNHCCPTPAMICNMPKDQYAPNTCAPTVRFWFNPATGICESYSTCPFGFNNFESPAACTAYCAGSSPVMTASAVPPFASATQSPAPAVVAATGVPAIPPGATVVIVPSAVVGEPLCNWNYRPLRDVRNAGVPCFTAANCPTGFTCHFDVGKKGRNHCCTFWGGERPIFG